jgi:uncharacterized membrane protein YdfJ with MMPL/SSD domain
VPFPVWSQAALAGGVAGSADVVTSAALIMVAVFSAFAALSLIDRKILGVTSRWGFAYPAAGL